MKQAASVPRPTKQLVIKRVRTQGEGQWIIQGPDGGTVAELKAVLAAIGGPPARSSSLVYNGQLLQDTWTTEAIPHGGTIMVFEKKGPPPVPPRRRDIPSTGEAASTGAPTPSVNEQLAKEALAEEVGECPICLDVFSTANPASQTTCRHSFHNTCLQEWKKHSTFCPLCRARLSAPASGGGGASTGTAPGTAPGVAPVTDKPLTRDEARVALEATRRALAGVVASAAVAAYAFVTSEEVKRVAKSAAKSAFKYGKMFAAYAGEQLLKAATTSPSTATGAGTGAGAGAGAGGAGAGSATGQRAGQYGSVEAATAAGQVTFQCPSCRQLVAVAPHVSLFKCTCGQVMRSTLQ